MKYFQKCCAQCPGQMVTSREDQNHDCCLPKYVSGNFKVSSLKKHVPGCPVRKKVESIQKGDRMSCYDKFAMARKLHAENLQHQPLPDKVDDEIFKKYGEGWRSDKKDLLKRKSWHGDKGNEIGERHRFGPALGCKSPQTRMDLAICWETPTDPIYEPKRPVHIDGSDGGAAPAIFTLVKHSPTSTKILCGSSNDLRIRPTDGKTTEDCFCENRGNRANTEQDPQLRNDGESQIRCCECLCEDFCSVDISKSGQEQPKRSCRKCVACDKNNLEKANKRRDYDPRLTRSAVGQRNGESSVQRNNGLPSKITIPRPKTPFARRSFCIDSLAPPFSVINGCRDADYPEHWRLMTIYQQSYRNPRKQKPIRR